MLARIGPLAAHAVRVELGVKERHQVDHVHDTYIQLGRDTSEQPGRRDQRAHAVAEEGIRPVQPRLQRVGQRGRDARKLLPGLVTITILVAPDGCTSGRGRSWRDARPERCPRASGPGCSRPDGGPSPRGLRGPGRPPQRG